MKDIKQHWWLVLPLLGLAWWLRVYRLDAPLADWHSFRQADTASVTREFVQHNYSLFEPHYHDVSNIQSGQNNPEGYRMVELPLVNYLIAHLLRFNPGLDLVIVSRLTSICFSLLGLVGFYGFTYLLSKQRTISFLSGLIYAVLPYSVFYSRVILPEPAMLGTQLASLWLFLAWLQQSSKNKRRSWVLYLLSLSFFSLSLLLKPTAVFIIPVYGVLALSYLHLGALFSPWLIAYGLVGVIPLIAWRQWIQNFPTGIPVATWLLNANGIRFRPAWWRWLFAERIAKLILGYWGVIFLFLGLVGKLKNYYQHQALFDVVTLTWTVSMFLYLAVFATGNVQHDYYQAPLIPIISLLVARGLMWLTQADRTRKLILWSTMGLVLALSLFMSWWEIRGYYDIQHPSIVTAGQKVAELTPSDALIIAPYQGDTAFLFQTQRRGWPIGFEIQDKINQGADYYVSINFDQETKELMEQYSVVEQTDEYVIISLD